MARASDLAYYQGLWDTITVPASRFDDVDRIARRIVADKARYMAVQAISGVPWPVVGIIHSLEAGGRWDAALHNGDRIIGTGKKTTRVPAGRGPFATWEEAAVDALRRWKGKAWGGVAEILHRLERYNGTGYIGKGVNSPYLWSFTGHYTRGKYVSDGKYDPNAVSQQAGAAAILWMIAVLGAWQSNGDAGNRPTTTSSSTAPAPLRTPALNRAIQQFLNSIDPSAQPLNIDGQIGPKTRALAARWGISFTEE